MKLSGPEAVPPPLSVSMQPRIELSFDPEYGYPTKASFQPHESDDQSEYFEISTFKRRVPAAPNTSLERTRER